MFVGFDVVLVPVLEVEEEVDMEDEGVEEVDEDMDDEEEEGPEAEV
jgi:hypothetical protein